MNWVEWVIFIPAVIVLLSLVGGFVYTMFIEPMREERQRKASWAACAERWAELETPPPPPPIELPAIDEVVLNDLCAKLLPKFPALPLPRVRIQPADQFRLTKHNRRALAHARGYQLIEFNANYVAESDYFAIVDTMMHELLHCWINHRQITDTSCHGDKFEFACMLLGIKYHAEWRKLDRETDMKVEMC